MINLSFQEFNYTLACINIFYPSKKDCSVAPWEGNKRCCYINYKKDGQSGGECIFVDDTEKALNSMIKEYSKDKSKINIDCNDNYIGKYHNFFLIVLLAFSFFINI